MVRWGGDGIRRLSPGPGVPRKWWWRLQQRYRPAGDLELPSPSARSRGPGSQRWLPGAEWRKDAARNRSRHSGAYCPWSSAGEPPARMVGPGLGSHHHLCLLSQGRVAPPPGRDSRGTSRGTSCFFPLRVEAPPTPGSSSPSGSELGSQFTRTSAALLRCLPFSQVGTLGDPFPWNGRNGMKAKPFWPQGGVVYLGVIRAAYTDSLVQFLLGGGRGDHLYVKLTLK